MDDSSTTSPAMSKAPQVATTHSPFSAFYPVLLLCLAVLGWSGFQSWQLMNERQQLQQFVAGQQPQVDNAGRLRASLDRLALSTRQLAQEGNPNARLLVDELQRRGVTINPAGAGGAAR